MRPLFATLALAAALVAPTGDAQAEPGVCPPIVLAFSENQIVAVTFGIHDETWVFVRQEGGACPTGSEDEAIEALKAQIRSGVIDATDFNGKRRLVPPSRVTAYVFPSLTQGYPN